MSKVSAIFWDLGRVLFPDVEVSNEAFKPVLDKLDITRKKSDEIFQKLWPDGIRLGKINEDDYWRQFLKISPQKPSILEIKRLYRKCIKPNQEVLDIVKKLSKHIDQYVVSNQGREWMDFLIKKWKLNKYFKDFFCSAYLGVAKPDKKFFEIALEKSGKNPSEIIYIDDNEKNILAAKNLGIKGIVFENPKKLKKELQEYL